MKNLTITYTMHGPGGDGSGTVELTMLPEIADTIMAGNPTEAVNAILDGMAQLQGYDYADFCGVEETD